jgi:hypothetical protein
MTYAVISAFCMGKGPEARAVRFARLGVGDAIVKVPARGINTPKSLKKDIIIGKLEYLSR